MKLANHISENINLQQDDEAFEHLFKTHFKALHAYAIAILRDEDTAEEVVQNMFLKFWEKRELLNIQTSVKAYLYKCVYHDSLNLLKHEKIKTKYQDFATYTMNSHNEPASSKVETTELERQIGLALNELPEQCRTIFQMSRFEELKYREIADQLGLSVKTIENQMGKALKMMRLKLADFLTLILLGLMYYKDFFN
ncbi:RNA polymerase sigma-70 factor (ECF subfamily) [Pedobacter africanus]|uniref:RNA polymerase sigma-70 factor (ECF subfamily) n=1 Tax=Pedobacter africanus TaxID=151894 RepID=A0ACC6KTJ2_9SPHI|nr:RNA polymerase sigma-70 factor [Pedobacter africanus]MDR6782510.1 RNA polymerase sigma-70 factor (ECF subfamily) [Pedobacter africanus]